MRNLNKLIQYLRTIAEGVYPLSWKRSAAQEHVLPTLTTPTLVWDGLDGGGDFWSEAGTVLGDLAFEAKDGPHLEGGLAVDDFFHETADKMLVNSSH